MLCYTAEVSIDLDKHQEFKEALDSQEFMFEVNLAICESILESN